MIFELVPFKLAPTPDPSQDFCQESESQMSWKITARNTFIPALNQIGWFNVGCVSNYCMAFTKQACGDVKLIHCWLTVIGFVL